MKTYLFSAILLPLFCFAGPDNRNYWDGEDYRKNYSEQKDPVSELIEHIPLETHFRILDIGCGDGCITNSLAEKVPFGSVLGIDVSPIMIDSAKKTFFRENLSFATLNALDIDYIEAFDTIVSFSALQWVKDQKSVISNVKKALKPGGHLYFQMPCEMPPAMDAAIQATVKKAHWAPYFEGFESGISFFSEEEYAHYIYEEGLTEHLIDARIRTHVFPSKNAFVGFLIQWFPYLEPLPLGKKMHFLNDVIHLYLESVPTDEKGAVYFPVKRLTVVASKPTQ